MDAMRDAYDQVYVSTMGRAGFILQHACDAYAAQTASDGSKTMGVIFALAGLYPERDLAIDEWCRSVWTAFGDSRQTIVDLLREYQIS